MIGLLTCLFLIVAAGLSAEAVRLGCRRRLMTPWAPRAARPVPAREPAPSVAELEFAGAADLA